MGLQVLYLHLMNWLAAPVCSYHTWRHCESMNCHFSNLTKDYIATNRWWSLPVMSQKPAKASIVHFQESIIISEMLTRNGLLSATQSSWADKLLSLTNNHLYIASSQPCAVCFCQALCNLHDMSNTLSNNHWHYCTYIFPYYDLLRKDNEVFTAYVYPYYISSSVCYYIVASIYLYTMNKFVLIILIYY